MERFTSRFKLAAIAGSVQTLLLIVFLAATVPTTQQCTVCTDNDKDGYGNGCALGPDCDDTNPNIHPGAEESLNGRDENCNGLLDDGVGVTVVGDAHYAYGEGGVIAYPTGTLTQSDAHCFSITDLYLGYDQVNCPAQSELQVTFFDASFQAITLQSVARDGTRSACSNCHYLAYDRDLDEITFRIVNSGLAAQPLTLAATKTATTTATSSNGYSPASAGCQCPPNETPCPSGSSPIQVGMCVDQNGRPQCSYFKCVPCDVDGTNCDAQACVKFKPDSCNCAEYHPPCGSGQIFTTKGNSCGCKTCEEMNPGSSCIQWTVTNNECVCSQCPANACSSPKTPDENCKCECPAKSCTYGVNQDTCECNECPLACPAGQKPNSSCSGCECGLSMSDCRYGIDYVHCQCLTCDPPQCKGLEIVNSSCRCECPTINSGCQYGIDAASCTCKQCGTAGAPDCPTCPSGLHLDGQKGCVCPDGKPAADASQCSPQHNCIFASDETNANRTCSMAADGSWCCSCLYGGEPSATVCCNPGDAFLPGQGCQPCGGSGQSCECSTCESGQCDASGKCIICDPNDCSAKNTGTVTGCTQNADCSCGGCHCANGGTLPNCTCPNGSAPGPNGECSCGSAADCFPGQTCSNYQCGNCPDGAPANPDGSCPTCPFGGTYPNCNPDPCEGSTDPCCGIQCGGGAACNPVTGGCEICNLNCPGYAPCDFTDSGYPYCHTIGCGNPDLYFQCGQECCPKNGRTTCCGSYASGTPGCFYLCPNGSCPQHGQCLTSPPP